MSGMDILFQQMLKSLKIDPAIIQGKIEELAKFAGAINQQLQNIENMQKVQISALHALISKVAPELIVKSETKEIENGN